MSIENGSATLIEKPQRFVILGCQRSKSSLLVDQLGQQAGVVCHGELFHEDHFELSRYIDKSHVFAQLGVAGCSDIARRDADQREFLDDLLSVSFEGCRWSGHKLLRGEGQAVYLSEMSDASVAKLVLIRNPTYVVTSKLIVMKTRQWVQVSGQTTRVDPIDIDLNVFLQYLIGVHYYLDMVLSYLRATEQNFQIIFADDILSKHGISELCRFFDIPYKQLSSTPYPQKQNSSAMSERVRNYDELQSLLRGTHFFAELEHDRVTHRERWLGYSNSMQTNQTEHLKLKLRDHQAYSQLEWALDWRRRKSCQNGAVRSEMIGAQARVMLARLLRKIRPG